MVRAVLFGETKWRGEKKKFCSLEVSSSLGGFLLWTSQKTKKDKKGANVDLGSRSCEIQLLASAFSGSAVPIRAPLM